MYKEIENAIKKMRNSDVSLQQGYTRLVYVYLKKPWPQFFTVIRWRFKSIAEARLCEIGYDG